MLMRNSVYDALKADIIACRLLPGTELREPELVARYAASRSPVRDALLRLEADGLVTIVPRQFSRVTPISVRDAEDLLRLRRLLEPEAAAEAARYADPAAVEALDRAAVFTPGSDFIDYNRGFHRTLATCARNRRLAKACIGVIEQSDRLVRVSVDQIEGRQPDRLIEEHRAIVTALRDRDARTAARLLREHIDAAEARILAALRRRPVVAD
jgi:DNA-binding GntR family transcriptional regulator